MEKNITEIREDTIIIKKVSDFDLTHTFDCGQCFRWNEEADGSWTGIAGGRVMNVKNSGDADREIHVKFLTAQAGPGPSDEDFVRSYFDLDRDYGEIKKTLSEGDPVMEKACMYGQGIRLLKQDPWEALISFIISQNSNIPRIKKCIETLCSMYGTELHPNRPAGTGQDRPASGTGQDRPASGRLRPDPRTPGPGPYDFPTYAALAAVTREDLAPVRLGYRDAYIVETARAVACDGAASLYGAVTAPAPEAEAYLRSLKGVGPKVANCILLFGLQKYECFPIDVWMRRTMSELYGFDEGDMKAMAAYAADHFGDLSGFAQQYLFYAARDGSGKQE